MKKHVSLLAIFVMLLGTVVFAQQQVIIGFSFADNTDAEFTADQGLSGNLGYNVRAENAAGDTRTLTYEAGAADYAASATGWDAGENDKFWSIKFKADGFQNFKVSSKQYADATGPKEFKIQYKIGNSGTWTDIDNNTVTLATDWTTGVVTELPLPSELNDPGTTSIYLRWIMTSNVSVENGTVDAGGVSRIDDIMVYGSPVPVPDVIIGFDFTDNTDVEFNADSGLEGNLGYDVRAENGAAQTTRTLSYTEGASGYAATAVEWDNGADDKFWSIKFKADGYHDFKVSSKQYSDATGPKEFKLQTRKSGGDWIDVTDGNITVAADWTTGEVAELALPAEINYPGTTSVYVRWIMTSNTSTSDATVDAAGVSKIDDIVVTGFSNTGIETTLVINSVAMYPNPCNGILNLTADEEIAFTEIYNLQGALVARQLAGSNEATLSTELLNAGIYIVRVYFNNDKNPVSNRIIVE
ncbi:MAG TPA: T9SS type A sorting domain-containing protein [Bacteroidales bacterium]|nr:T9SS type A sorting domain-containing protein [Bacteroidales bacterium]